MTATSTTAPQGSLGDELASKVDRMRNHVQRGHTRSLAWRDGQLAALGSLLDQRTDELSDALASDLGKSKAEAWLTEIGFVAGEVAHLRKHLPSWIKPRRVPTPMVSQPGRSMIVPEPLGVVAIIAPWNYPAQLLLAPLAGALAAGNAAVVKPSEVAPATSAVIARLLPAYLDPEAVVVVEGGVEETTALLSVRFDHIFYTGNGTVGRVVMRAAAEHLTPVTLELGGKSPTIVDAGADLRVAARRIAWGKFMNAGQTCIAPDYVLVARNVRDRFVAELATAVRGFYGDDPRTSRDYGRIINDRHFARVERFLADGRIVIGGTTDASTRYIAPTVAVDVPLDAAVMNEEIFGPVLPVLAVDSIDGAIAFVNERPKPLALYVFASDDAVVDQVLTGTSAGGVTVNGTLMHISSPHLPFGGVGESGIGAYHGKASFDLFTHHKPVLRRSTRLDPSIAYPPYGAGKMRVLTKLL